MKNTTNVSHFPLLRPGEVYVPPRGWRIRRSQKVSFNDPIIADVLGADRDVESVITFWCKEESVWAMKGSDATCYRTRQEAEGDAFFLASQHIESMIDVVEW